MANLAAEARAKVKAAHPEAVVVERKKNNIQHRLADAPDGKPRFALDCFIGPIHYGPAEDQEIDTAFVASTAAWDYEMTKADFHVRALSRLDAGQVIEYRDGDEWVRFQPMALQYSNDLDQIQPIAMPAAVDAQVEDDTLTWADGYGPGRTLSWQAQTARLAKRLTISSLPPVEQFILDGGNPCLELNFIFAYSGGVTPYINGEPWTGPMKDVDTQGLVEFRDSGGKVLWCFNLPRSWDAEGNGQLGTLRFKRVKNALYVSHRVPLGFVQGAVYPLTVDVDVDEQVGASADDAHHKSDLTSFYYDMDYVYFGHSDGVFYGYYRWSSVAVPQGTTPDVANVQWYAKFDASDGPITYIKGIDEDNVEDFDTSASELNGRTRTTEYVSYNIGAWTKNTWYTSPDISDVLAELFESGSWASGDPLAIVCEGQEAKYATATSYDGNSTKGAKLHIEYTAGAAGQPTMHRTQGVPTGPGYRDRPGRWN